MATSLPKTTSLKSVLLSVLASSLLTTTAIAGDAIRFDRAAFLMNFKGGNEGQKAALEMALANVASADPTTMYMAAAVACKAGKLEDAAFLYYAAQMRARFDVQRFRVTGGGGVGSLYGALSNQVGELVNPAIVRDPQALAAALTRVEGWNVQPSGSYDPGWKVGDSAKMNGDEEAALSKALKDDAMSHLRPMSALLSDPEYFSAFMTFQAFNLAPFKEQQDPNRITEKERAEETLLKIENDKKLSYLTGILKRQRK